MPIVFNTHIFSDELYILEIQRFNELVQKHKNRFFQVI